MTQPIFLSWFLLYFRDIDENGVTFGQAAAYGTAVVALALSVPLLQHLYLFNLARLGMRIKVALSALIFRKAMSISKGEMCFVVS